MRGSNLEQNAFDTEDRDCSERVSPRPAILSSLRKHWFRALLIACIGFAAHVPALQGQLIWDDQYLARDNPFIKSPVLALEAFRHYLFLDSFSVHYRPVQNLSFMVDYFFWNTNTFGFHLTNALLHAGCGILLYYLLRRIFRSLGNGGASGDQSIFAFVVAAIWAVHPVHSAAVDYISGRADSLAFLFAAIAWLLYFRARDGRGGVSRAGFGLLAFAAGLLALCSRESGLLWVVLFAAFVIGFDRAAARRMRVAVIGALILLVTAYGALRHLPVQRPNAGPSMGWSGPVRSILMLRALGDYGRLMVFPWNLHMERSVFSGPAFENETARETSVELEYLSVLGAIVACSLGASCFWRTPTQRIRVFGTVWFVVGFLPISNLFDLNATVAEHWLYLPSVGLLIVIAASLIELRSPRACAVAASLVVMAFGARSFYRSSDWVDPETFYQRTAAAGGTSCRVMVNLAQIYDGRGEYGKAEQLFRRILTIQPDYTIARNNLADALMHLGRESEAEQVLKDAAIGAHESKKDYPRTWIAAANLSRILEARGDSAGALTILRKAQSDYPNTWELLSYQGEILRRENRFDEAVKVIEPYANANRWHYTSWMALGRVLAEKGEVERADAALRHASWLDIHSAEPLNLIAVIRMGQNRFAEAVHAQQRAVARQPEQPSQYVLLSNILDKMGRVDEAQAALAQISRLRSLAGTEKLSN